MSSKKKNPRFISSMKTCLALKEKKKKLTVAIRKLKKNFPKIYLPNYSNWKTGRHIQLFLQQLSFYVMRKLPTWMGYSSLKLKMRVMAELALAWICLLGLIMGSPDQHSSSRETPGTQSFSQGSFFILFSLMCTWMNTEK